MKYKYVFVLFLFCSCKTVEQKDESQEYSVIDLTEVEYTDKSPKLSEFVDSISYIRLDEESLIGDIWLAGIVVTDDAIFIDERQIYKYTSDGKFLLSLFRKGNGPEEAIKNVRGIYNFEKKYVTFPNAAGLFYNLYSFDGKFLGYQNKNRDEDPDDKFDIEKTKSTKMICGYLGDIQVYAYSYQPFIAKIGERLNPNGPILLYAKDLVTDSVIIKLQNYHFDIKATKQMTSVRPNGYPLDYGNIDSCYWVRPVMLDTLYRTSDFKSLLPWYVFKLKESAADYAFQVHNMLMDIDESEYGRETLMNVYALPSGVLFEYSTATTAGIGYCKAGGKAKAVSRYFENDLDGYLKELSIEGLGEKKLSQRDGYLYALVNAEEFLKEGAKSPFPDLTEESNPVVVKLKLKK